MDGLNVLTKLNDVSCALNIQRVDAADKTVWRSSWVTVGHNTYLWVLDEMCVCLGRGV